MPLFDGRSNPETNLSAAIKMCFRDNMVKPYMYLEVECLDDIWRMGKLELHVDSLAHYRLITASLIGCVLFVADRLDRLQHPHSLSQVYLVLKSGMLSFGNSLRPLTTKSTSQQVPLWIKGCLDVVLSYPPLFQVQICLFEVILKLCWIED